MHISGTRSTRQARESEEVEIRVARSLPEVEALRELWTAWPGHRDSDIDFYLMIVQSYPEVVRPHVIALYRRGEPVAILVGRLERKQLSFRMGYLPGFRLWARCLTFVYGAIHGDASPGSTEILVRSVINSLRQDEADVALLEFVPIDTPLYQLALNLPGILGRDTLPAAQTHDRMVVPESIDHVYRRMSAKHRKNLRREVRQLFDKDEGARIVCYQNDSELGRLFHDAEEIAKKTYQRALGAGFADNRRVHQRLALAAQKGWLRGNVLYIGDRPVAFWIGMLYGGTFVSEYLGYDPEFRNVSPGMVLIMRVIEGFCNRANGDIINELDFGLGHAEYKESLRSDSWVEAAVYVFSPTLKGLVLKSARTTTRLVDASARRMLSSTDFWPRLKRTWRDRLAKRANGRPNAEKPDAAAVPAAATSSAHK